MGGIFGRKKAPGWEASLPFFRQAAQRLRQRVIPLYPRLDQADLEFYLTLCGVYGFQFYSSAGINESIPRSQGQQYILAITPQLSAWDKRAFQALPLLYRRVEEVVELVGDAPDLFRQRVGQWALQGIGCEDLADELAVPLALPMLQLAIDVLMQRFSWNADSQKVADRIAELSPNFEPPPENWFSWAARNKVDKLRAALAQGQLPDEATEKGRTALMLAASYGHQEAVAALLQAGANPNHQDHGQLTALTAASAGGHLGVVEQLLAAGVDANHRDYKRMTPLMYAAASGQEELVARLLAAGADPNAQDDRGIGCLMTAADAGKESLVRLLVQAGGQVDQQDLNGGTVLMGLAASGQLELVRLFVEQGADVNRADHSGWTALMSAACRGHIEVVRLLLAAGARPEAQDDQGKTARDHADGFPEVQVLLA